MMMIAVMLAATWGSCASFGADSSKATGTAREPQRPVWDYISTAAVHTLTGDLQMPGHCVYTTSTALAAATCGRACSHVWPVIVIQPASMLAKLPRSTGVPAPFSPASSSLVVTETGRLLDGGGSAGRALQGASEGRQPTSAAVHQP